MDWPVPPDEAARSNPLTASTSNLKRGEPLFERYCTACHGVRGRIV